MAGAEERVQLEVHPVPGMEGPTGDEIWILHRVGRYTRWHGCPEATVGTDSLNYSLGIPDRDTAWEPHLVVHELLSWLVPDVLTHRVNGPGKQLRACGMGWFLD